MEGITSGEEVDTLHMIQGKKGPHFFLPDPLNNGASREKDSAYAEKLKELNTLDLIDFDKEYGTIYFANGGHISTLDANPYNLTDHSDVINSIRSFSIGHDQCYIRALKLIKEKSLILISVNDKILIHSILTDGSIGENQFAMKLSENENIGRLGYHITENNDLYVIVVDSNFTLLIIDYQTQTATTKGNVVDASFIEGMIFCLDKEGSSLHIIDPSAPGSELKSIGTSLEDLCSIEYLKNQNSIAIFWGESPLANVSIFEFNSNVSKEDIISFDFTEITQFEEMFDPSDNILELPGKYKLLPIGDTRFNFSSYSFGESIDALYKTEENKWARVMVEEQSIRLLAPVDSEGEIPSFKGVIHYPFKFTPDDPDT